MILFLLIFIPILVLVGAAGYYSELIIVQQERIARQAETETLQAEEIAKLRQALAKSEAQRDQMFDAVQRSAVVVCEQDATIAELRGWLAIVMPKAMKITVGRWN